MTFCKNRCAVALVASLGLGLTAQADVMLVDFSRDNGVDGNATANPDGNGNTWNNFNTNGSFDVFAGSALNNLVTTANVATDIDLVVQSAFFANGIQNGGLLSPDAGKLGDFAVGTATQDYFFTETPNLNNLSTLTIEGLDPTAEYTFRFFGTRATDATRITQYELIGGNGTFSQNLQTSGAGAGSAGNGNDDDIAVLSGLMADGDNKITLNLRVIEGGFAYLGAMEITETVVPEPAAAGLLAMAGMVLVGGRRRKA